MKILLKILVTPFALALSLLAVLLVFLFEICAVLLTIASVTVSYTHLDVYKRQAVSSIFPTLGSGLANALSGTSYASEDTDLLGVDEDYTCLLYTSALMKRMTAGTKARRKKLLSAYTA